MSKVLGWVLSIDQASNAAGVALFWNGQLVDSTVLVSQSLTDPFSRRVQHQVPQLTAFLSKHLKPGQVVEKVIFEAVRARLVMVTVGAFLTCPYIAAKLNEKQSFVESSTWKRWAREHGAKEEFFKDIKGCSALRDTGFDMKKHGIVSDDVSDAILQFYAWRDRK